MSAKSQFHIHQAKDGQFYTELTAANGETLTISEMLTKRDSAGKNIRAQVWAVLQIVEEWFGTDSITLKQVKERMEVIDAKVMDLPDS